MSSHRKCASLLFAGFLAFMYVPLGAQLNPKWQTINSPDFLDLYQQSTGQSVKPEIGMVFDFTGSMQEIMYDKRMTSIPPGGLSWGSGMRFTLSRTGYAPFYTYACSATLGCDVYNLKNGMLIRPDGNAVTEALINANYVAHSPALDGELDTPKASSIYNWVRSASHVRFSCTVGSDLRTVDVPIPWTILDDLNVSATNPAMKMYNTYPLKMTIKDPVSGTEVELDSRYFLEDTMVWSNEIWNSDTMTATLPKVAYASKYVKWLFDGKNASGQYIIPDVNSAMNGKTVDGVPKSGFANGIPSRTRSQAIKDATLRVWNKYYDRVYLAFRFIHNSGSSLESSDTVNLSSDTKNFLPSAVPSDPPTSTAVAGFQRGWLLMNGHSLGAMRQLAVYDDGGGTPLNAALANALAQFNDPDSVFNEVNSKPKECMKHFVILFTDGEPNSESGNYPTSVASPYISGGIGNVLQGNAVFAADPTKINPRNDSSSYFNILNLAALAAHGGDKTQASWIATPTYPGDTTYPAGKKAANLWLPFWISQRNGTAFTPHHPIQTMTVGVSLTGNFTDPSSSKYRMFAAACLGDPLLNSWNLNPGHLIPFALSDPLNPNSAKDPNSVYYFDANDPQTLVGYLDKAFEASTALSNNSATAAPVLPTMGSGLGACVYLAKFKPPKSGGPVWPGDLLMFPITTDRFGVTLFLDTAGNSCTALEDPDNAQWAASKILTDKSRAWYNRVIYTRVPSTSSTMHPPMLKVTIGSTDTASTVSSSGYTAIKSMLPGGSDVSKFDNWRYFIGANLLDATHTPVLTRNDVMGDVVGSTPAVLSYSTLPSTVSSSTLTTAWSKHKGQNPRFSVIFVGTNQGFLHAFGEVSWFESITAGGDTFMMQKGVADELWAFVPTDILPYIDYFRNAGNIHRASVDGSPTAYLLDLPAAHAVRGNGVFDVGSTKERAIVIFGLGKGGRSYYAIDVRDPANPVFAENNSVYGAGMGWSLCPDEPSNYPDSRFQAPAYSSSRSVVTNMGLSTSVPSLGRVVATSAYLAKDIVFLGGGFSSTEIESKLPSTPNPPPNTDTRLGRSALALDMKGGNILGVWDLTSNNTVGPISTGVVPHMVFSGSGFHQRAYFTDYFGGLWALGDDTRDSFDLRRDSSYLNDWSAQPRPVYKQAAGNGVISTLPVPFSVPAMPLRTSTPTINPAAVGIAFVTGDRNNPLDKNVTDWSKPTQHRLNVVFDRQDSYLLSLDSNGIANSQMANAKTLSSTEKNPSDSSFYLKNKYGYYVDFKAGSTFVPKGMFSPLVLNGRLFYSYFEPVSADACSGGQGETNTFRIANLMLPDATTSDAPDVNHSGRVLVWNGLASPFTIRNLLTGIQAGISGGSGTNSNPSGTQNMKIQNLNTGGDLIFPRPRVWRTVH